MKHVKAIGVAVVLLQVLTVAAGSISDFCRRAEAGERLTVAFHGGSLTWGANATDPNRTSWRALVGRRLAARYPAAHFTFVDAAIGGTDSQLGVFRLDRDVLAYKPDLLILEWCCNDGIDGADDNRSCSYEGIVRHYLEAKPDGTVAQVVIPTKETIEREDEATLKRRTERIAFGKTYGIATADLLGELRRRHRTDGLDLGAMWPPEIGDMVHPLDPGYALYADVIWDQLFEHPSAAVANVPQESVFRWKYRNVIRKRLSEARSLPAGWRNGFCEMRAGTFDFLCSRWQDGTTIATNNTPLRARFKGEVLLIFGESTAKSGKVEIWVDGKKAGARDCGAFGRAFTPSAYLVWQVGCEFDGDKWHDVEIRPQLENGQELKIESLCVAGENAAQVEFEDGDNLQAVCQRLVDEAVASGEQGGVQFCAYRDGKCIVNVWAGSLSTNTGAAKVDGRTLFPIFSTEKPLLATAVHRAVEKELMDYDKPLCTWWPEFRGDGKEKLTLRETLGYRSGMPGGCPGKLTNRDLTDWKLTVRTAAADKPELEPGTKQRYMPLAYAWMLGHPLEIAVGKPLGDVLREYVLMPCGIEKDFYFAADDEAMTRIATFHNCSEFVVQMNKDWARRACLPSAWAVASARGIAKFYNRLCGFDGKAPLIRKETLDNALKPCRHPSDPLPDAETMKDKWFMIFGMGYGLWGEAERMDRVFGHGGAGGSEGLVDRDNRLVVAYTCNFDNHKGGLRQRLYDAVGMKWRYWKDKKADIQTLQMKTVKGK